MLTYRSRHPVRTTCDLNHRKYLSCFCIHTPLPPRVDSHPDYGHHSIPPVGNFVKWLFATKGCATSPTITPAMQISQDVCQTQTNNSKDRTAHLHGVLCAVLFVRLSDRGT